MSANKTKSPAVEKPMGSKENGAKHNASPAAVTLSASSEPMTLDAVRRELKGMKGKKFWRSLDELANTPEFQAAVEREFPSAAQEWIDPVSRRGFLKLMGASMALAGLAGCTKQPDEPIYPYVKAPEDLILGKPMYFATAHPFTTGAVPLLVKSDEFRPDQDRRQSRARLQPRRLRSLFAGHAARSLRSRPLAARHLSRREPRVGRICRGAARQSHFDQRWNRHLLPERDHYVADAGAAVEGSADGVCPRQSWCSTIRRSQERSSRVASMFSTT